MAATKTDAPNAPSVLDFDAIDARAQALGIESLHEHLQIDETTVWRWRNGLVKPLFETVKQVAEKLGLTIDEITAKGNPTSPPPSGPSNPSSPSGPSTPSVPPSKPSKAA